MDLIIDPFERDGLGIKVNKKFNIPAFDRATKYVREQADRSLVLATIQHSGIFVLMGNGFTEVEYIENDSLEGQRASIKSDSKRKGSEETG